VWRAFLVGLAWSFVLVLLQSLGRLVLYLAHGVGSTVADEVIKAFLFGMRFDLSVVGYLLFLYLTLVLGLALLRRWFPRAAELVCYQKLPHMFLLGSTVALLLVYVGNLGFFSYFHDHLNARVYDLFRDDTWAILVTAWRDQPLVKGFFVLLGVSAALHFSLRGLRQWVDFVTRTYTPSRRALSVVIASSLVFCFLLGRGSLNFKMPPLGRMHIDISQDPFVNQLAFHPMFAFVKVLQARGALAQSFNVAQATGFSDRILEAHRLALQNESIASLEQAHRGYWRTFPGKAPAKKPHVVVFLMESMGEYWLRFDSTQFPILSDLRSHFQEDVVFRRFLPMCSGTHCTLSYFWLNALALPGPDFAQVRRLDTNHPTGVAWPFQRAGYRTIFVYGGPLGWRGLSSLAPRVGFKEQVGSQGIKQALGKAEYFDHDWGIMDEHVFEYVQKQLDEATVPTMIFALTTGNHPPFQIPPTFADQALSEVAPQIVERSSMSRERFLSHVKNSSLADNTLVMATGDHNFFDVVNFGPEEFPEWRGVPLYMYWPKSLRRPIDVDKWASQETVFPTLYELAIPEVHAGFTGRSLLDSGRPSLAVNDAGMIHGDHLLYLGRVYTWSSEQKKFVLDASAEATSRINDMSLWLRARQASTDDLLTNGASMQFSTPK
jgi:phosphoglycerol transferase MdoB-like AlkP superfamily enzyme